MMQALALALALVLVRAREQEAVQARGSALEPELVWASSLPLRHIRRSCRRQERDRRIRHWCKLPNCLRSWSHIFRRIHTALVLTRRTSTCRLRLRSGSMSTLKEPALAWVPGLEQVPGLVQVLVPALA
jgi:hypothetical protein